MAESTGTGALTLPAAELSGAGKRWDKNYPAIANLLIPSVRAALTYSDIETAIGDASEADQAALLALVKEGAQKDTGISVLTLVNDWITAEATDQAKTMTEGDSLDFDDFEALL